MKKNLLLIASLVAGFVAQAQDCTAVATLNEDFSDFTISTSWTAENCWNKIALGYAGGGGMIYTAESGDPANQYITFYAAVAVNVNSYLTTPEISTIDGAHELSFTAWKLGQNGTVPAGTVTLQVGTMTDVADAATFVAFGDAITISDDVSHTYSNIVLPETTVGTYIAFRISADTQHNALAIDDVVWSEVPATEPTCEAVATLDENFSTFTDFSESCWSASAGVPMVYIDGEAVTFYSLTSPAVNAYLVSPELTTIDGNHSLSFDAGKLATSAPGNLTVQVGTLSSPTDYSTFVAVGEPVTLETGSVTYDDIVIPASETQVYIAFQMSASGNHVAGTIDNVKWTESTTGIDDVAQNTFSIFPNPATGKNITVAFSGNSAGFISIYSMTGAKVFETKANASASQNLDLSSLSSGMYVVKVQAGNSTATQKLILQ
jgi:Secretion system C-terminal sorting domain